MSTINEQIREIRKSRKLTQQQLADASNLTRNSIKQIEMGLIKPSQQAVERIAAALNCRYEQRLVRIINRG